MRPDGVNGTKPTLKEQIDAVNVSGENVSAEVENISTSVDKKIREFFSQGSEDNEKISKGEKETIGTLKTSIINLYYRMRSEYVKAGDEATKAYKKVMNNLLTLIQRANSAEEGKNPYEQASLEPEETDAEQNKYNTKYYKELTKKANERLAELQKEKDSIEAERKWYRQHSPFGYYGRTPEDAGEYAMKEIAEMFLGHGSVEDDANYLIQWANNMWTGGKISSGEKKILTDRADEKLASIRMQKAREQQSDDSPEYNNTQASEGETNSDNDFWKKYHKTMQDAVDKEREKEQADINEILYGS